MALFLPFLNATEKRRPLTVSVFVILLLGVVWVWRNSSNINELYQQTQRRQNEEQKLRVADQRVSDLEDRIRLLKSSDYEAMRRIRKQWGAKDGERIQLYELEKD